MVKVYILYFYYIYRYVVLHNENSDCMAVNEYSVNEYMYVCVHTRTYVRNWFRLLQAAQIILTSTNKQSTSKIQASFEALKSFSILTQYSCKQFDQAK